MLKRRQGGNGTRGNIQVCAGLSPTKIPNITENDIPYTSNSHINLKCETEKQFTFNEINDRQVYETILKLDRNKGPGIDEFNIKCLKYIADIISPHLTILFNTSILEGQYPDLFKISICIPIFKGGNLNHEDPINYRPISILNGLNKVFERIMHDQMTYHLETHKLLPWGCKDIKIEPELLPVNSQQFKDSTNTQPGARLDVSARGIFSRFERSFCDIRVTYPNCLSNIGKPIADIYVEHQNQKKDEYEERVIESEKGSFVPLIFTTSGGMSPDCKTFFKRVAKLTAGKNKEHLPHVTNHIRTGLRFAILRSTLIGIRGERGKVKYSIKYNIKMSDISLNIVPTVKSYECRWKYDLFVFLDLTEFLWFYVLLCMYLVLWHLPSHHWYSIYIKHKLLPYFQYGYRKQHNIGQAILDYTHTINNNLKQNYTSISIFMDLSKAFDTVNRHILCNKLKKLGFDTNSCKLIENYMTNRKFCFKNEKEYYNLEHGVLQGSILGPLLFLIYIYDMKHIAPNNKVIVYADDTTVIVKGRNVLEAIQHSNDIVDRFLLYFNQNKLSINPDKTNYTVYQPRTSENKYTPAHLIMNNKKLEHVKVASRLLHYGWTVPRFFFYFF